MARMHLRPILILLACVASLGAVGLKKLPPNYVPPRPPIAGLHVGMSADSVDVIFRKIALRSRILHVDSLRLIESDSVSVFGEPAYVRAEEFRGKVRTLVVNFHPLSGDHYLNTRDLLPKYLERFFGRGVITRDQSVTNRRWETEDGTMEVSYTDKYLRIFMRLGKR